MVSVSPAAPNQLSFVTPSSPRPSERPIREKASPIATTPAAVGCLEGLRCQHLAPRRDAFDSTTRSGVLDRIVLLFHVAS